MAVSFPVGIFLRRVGPYHYARFKEASKMMDLHVIETRPDSEEYPWDFNPKSDFHIHSLGRPKNREKGFRGKTLVQNIVAVIEKIKPKVIVTVGWADPEYHAVFLVANEKNLPLVLVSDSTYSDSRRYILLEYIKRQIIKKFGSALVAGTRSKAYLTWLGFDCRQIFFPWDVVDNDYFENRIRQLSDIDSLTSECPFQSGFFLCVARFIPKKNLLGLIDAHKDYCKVSKRSRHLVILGSGELMDQIKNRAADLLNSKIFLPGFIQYDELPAFYKAAYFLILPSLYDQWGLVANEAMASGVPVVVSKQCGCSEDLVSNWETGFQFDADDLKSLTDILLITDTLDKNSYQELSANCKYRINDMYGLKHFSVALASSVELALRSKNKPLNLVSKMISRFRINT